MRAAVVLTVAAARLVAASYTTSGPGNWNNAATWGGAGVPGTSDTCTISHTVTVQAGDAILTLPGSSHGLKQTGKEDLVVLIDYKKENEN